MAAHAKLKDDHSNEFDRNLAEDIARAMQHRPLMSRLARIEAAYAELPGVLPPRAASAPPPIPANQDAPPSPLAANGAPATPIDQLMEEFGAETTTPPSSAEWLGKARRERNRARMRNVAAWFATLTIGGTIIALTTLMIKT